MIVSTPQLIALALVALAAIGVGGYATYFGVKQTRSLWRATASAPHARRVRAAMVASGVVAALIGLTFWAYLFKAVLAR